jgi:hypothetical protein
MPGGGNTFNTIRRILKLLSLWMATLELKLKDGVKVLKPGESYTVAPMQLHAFFTPTSRRIKFAIKIEPGHEGI